MHYGDNLLLVWNMCRKSLCGCLCIMWSGVNVTRVLRDFISAFNPEHTYMMIWKSLIVISHVISDFRSDVQSTLKHPTVSKSTHQTFMCHKYHRLTMTRKEQTCVYLLGVTGSWMWGITLLSARDKTHFFIQSAFYFSLFQLYFKNTASSSTWIQFNIKFNINNTCVALQ